MVRRVTGTPSARRALIIAHEPDGTGAEVERCLLDRGFVCDTHLVTDDYDRPNHHAPFPDFADYDLIVPMGSVRSLTAKHEIDNWIHDEVDRIREAHERGTPVFGVCFGGQLIADALGGKVENAPVLEIGWYEIRPVDGATLPAGPGPWMEWHHDRIVPPPDAEIIAETDEAVQLFRIGTTVGTQFHPEVDEAHVRQFVEEATDEYLASCGVTREQLIADAAANEERNRLQCAALIDWYLDEVCGF